MCRCVLVHPARSVSHELQSTSTAPTNAISKVVLLDDAVTWIANQRGGLGHSGEIHQGRAQYKVLHADIPPNETACKCYDLSQSSNITILSDIPYGADKPSAAKDFVHSSAPFGT